MIRRLRVLRDSSLVPASVVWMSVAIGAGLGGLPATVYAQSSATALQVDLDARRPGDEREVRTFVLGNGLEVLLVSDPKMQKSAAALDVAVGSMEDPENGLGQAHFLEHLLFLGTKKYPDVEAYSEFLAANGGSGNAYTADENTNYQFEVNHDALEGALDRFAQFFIEPVFNPEFVERERNAVNSEHQKNVQADNWRANQVFTMMAREGHPFGKFSTGTLETLSGATREQIMDFYEKAYSANVMKLCVMGNHSLDTLEQWTREKFAAVPTIDRADLSYPTDVWDPKALPRMVEIKPVTEQRSVTLEFAMPSAKEHWRAKPLSLLGSLIGHEGKGSLLSQLKKEDLATGLSAGGQSQSFASFFRIRITLTENGRANVDRVVELSFAYLDMLRDKGLQKYFYDEEKLMADIAYVYRDHEEGMWTAASYAASMQDHPPLDILKNERVYFEFAPKLFESYLEAIRPETMQLTLVAPDVTTDTVEEFYGAEYRVAPIAEERVARWMKAKATKAFAYPEKNPFLPNDLSLLENDPVAEPHKLVDDERGTFWFEQDRTFHLPKAEVDLLFLTDLPRSSARHRLLATLYARVIDEGLNEWRYPAVLAGLHAGVSGEHRGIRVSVGGYAQRVPDLLTELCGRLQKVTIDERTFAALKDDLRRELANAVYSQAYQQAFYEFNILTNPEAIHRQHYTELVDSITLDEVKTFAKQVLKEGSIEGVAYGNLDPKALRAGVDQAFDAATDSVLPVDRRPGNPFVQLANGSSHSWVLSTKSDNHCWLTMLQFGPRDYRREAILRLGAAYLESGFYGEMRSRQQLGYIVWSFASLNNPIQGMGFLIQSGDYPAAELRARATTYLAEALPKMSEIPEEEFGALKSAIKADLLQVDTNIDERMGTLGYEAVRLNGDLKRNAKVAAALESITAEEMAEAFLAAFAEDTRASLTVYYDADGAETTVPEEPVIANVDDFRSSLPVVF